MRTPHVSGRCIPLIWTSTVYIGSLLSYNINGNGAFVIASGAILGLCAALL